MDDGNATSTLHQPSTSSRKSFFFWLQSIRSDLVEGKRQRLAELRRALAEKHAAVLLTSNEVLLRNALEVYSVSELGYTSINAATIKTLLDVHRAHTFDCAASSQDYTAFVSYATLLVTLHIKYVSVHTTDEEIASSSSHTRINPLRDWTGIEDGPTFDQDGGYQSLGHFPLITREALAKTGDTEEWDDILSYAAVSKALQDLCSRLNGDLRNSQTLWNVRRRFETLHDEAGKGQLEAAFLERLDQPHYQLDETAQLFSSFTTSSRPVNEYESVMASTYQVVAKSKGVVAMCEQYEDAIKASNTTSANRVSEKWQGWKQYTRWAALSVISPKGRPSISSSMATSIFERALSQCGMSPSCTEEAVHFGKHPLTKKGFTALRGTESKEERNIRIEREKALLLADVNAAAELWMTYLRFLGHSDISLAIVLDVCERARKAQSHHGGVQASALRTMRRKGVNASLIDAHFTSALANEDLRKSGEQTAQLLLGRIDVTREENAQRRMDDGRASTLMDALSSLVKDEGDFMDVYGLMTFALDSLASCESPDESLCLEQACSDWCIAGGEAYATLAESIWKAAVSKQPGNGLVWLRAACFYMTTGDFKQAMHTVRRGLGRHEIAASRRIELAELLVRLSHVGGSMADIEHAFKCLSEERERQWNEYYTSLSTASANESLTVAMTSQPDTEMMDDESTIGSKRKNVETDNSSEKTASASNAVDKKVRQGDARLTRDREFASIIVDQLPSDIAEKEIVSLFSDCGEIFEITGPKVLSMMGDEAEPQATALLEFASRDSVPAARSKHLKALRGHQIEVQLGYECTLYVTNFPIAYDSDEAIRALFSRSGRIFDIRWPSKKYSSTRRFCYVVFCNADDARKALALHETDLDDEGERKKLQVFLSDPHRKKVRSDAFNDDKELFVSGISRAVTEDTLKELFAPGVQHVRIPKHPDGRNRGIAYVDMATVLDAQRVVGRSAEMDGGGYRINGKLITVNPVDKKKHSDASHTNTDRLDERLDVERRNRCLYLRGLPSDAQEPLIQQLVERYIGPETVKRVEWTAGTNNNGQAIIEFTDAKHAGLASLSTGEMLYADTYPVRFAPLEKRGAAAALIPRQAGSARRSGRGRGAPAFVRPQQSHSSINGNQSAMNLDHAIGDDAETHANSSAKSGGKGQDAFRQMLYKN